MTPQPLHKANSNPPPSTEKLKEVASFEKIAGKYAANLHLSDNVKVGSLPLLVDTIKAACTEANAELVKRIADFEKEDERRAEKIIHYSLFKSDDTQFQTVEEMQVKFLFDRLHEAQHQLQSLLRELNQWKSEFTSIEHCNDVIQNCRKQIVALLRDKERLDWLLSDKVLPNGCSFGSRQAIDAAIQSQAAKEKETE